MRARGFTLTELLVVIVIIGVFAGLAAVAFNRTRKQGDVDRFAVDVRDVMTRARRRAVATGTTYIVDVRPTSIAYCQQDPTNLAQNRCPTAAAAQCPAGSGTPCESVRPYTAKPSATVAFYANTADLGNAPAPIVLGPGGAAVYFLPNGSATAGAANAAPTGFTAYLYESASQSMHRKVIVNSAAGRPRIIDTW